MDIWELATKIRQEARSKRKIRINLTIPPKYQYIFIYFSSIINYKILSININNN